MKSSLRKVFCLLTVAGVAMALAMPAFAGAPSVQENQNAGAWNGVWDFGHGPMVAPIAGTDGSINGVTIKHNNGVPHRGTITYPLHTGILRDPNGVNPDRTVYFVLSDTDEGNFAQEFGVTLIANNLKMTKAGAMEFQSGETFDVDDPDTGVITTVAGSDFEFHPDLAEPDRWVFFNDPGTTNFLKPGPDGVPLYYKANSSVGPLAGMLVPNIDPETNVAKPLIGPPPLGGGGPPATFLERVSVFLKLVAETSTTNPDEAACYTRADGVTPLTPADIPKFNELGLVINANGCVAERVLINALPAKGPFGVTGPMASNFSPLKRLRWNGKDVTVNVSYVQWGDKPNQRLIVDKGGCDPLIRKNPPNPFSLYGGGPTMSGECYNETWADRYKGGQTLEINIDSQGPIAASAGVPTPNVVKKLQQGSYMTDGDHPYYIPWEMSKGRAASVLGNIWAPKLAKMGPYTDKNRAVGRVIQFDTGRFEQAGGPGRFQHGLESYRGGIGRYTPMWHVSFLFYNCKDDPNGLLVGDDNFLVTPTPNRGALHTAMAKDKCNVSLQVPGSSSFPNGTGNPLNAAGLQGAGTGDGSCVPPFAPIWQARKFMGLQMKNLGAQCNAQWLAEITGTADLPLDDQGSRLIRNIRHLDDLKDLGLILETETPGGLRMGEFGTPAGPNMIVSCPAPVDVNL
ncbi:MAG: hypothetical protein ACE5G9_08010 [Nitrospinales bacterium]